MCDGYDAEGKLWTVQYIKEDGTKRFAKNSPKHGCFHVIGAQNGQAAIQKIAMSPVVVIAEGYATAVTFAKHGKVPTLAAYDAGHLLSVATALHQRYPDKAILEDLFERTALSQTRQDGQQRYAVLSGGLTITNLWIPLKTFCEIHDRRSSKLRLPLSTPFSAFPHIT